MHTNIIDTKEIPKKNFLIGLLIGLIFIAASVYAICDDIKFKRTSNETTAQVIDITKETKTSGIGKNKKIIVEHSVTVSYLVDNVSYNSKLNYYSVFMREGGEIRIYYDPLDPSDIRGPYISFLIILIMGMGVFLSIFCVKSYLKADNNQNDEG